MSSPIVEPATKLPCCDVAIKITRRTSGTGVTNAARRSNSLAQRIRRISARADLVNGLQSDPVIRDHDLRVSQQQLHGT
jgi:hypothetical protein